MEGIKPNTLLMKKNQTRNKNKTPKALNNFMIKTLWNWQEIKVLEELRQF